MGAVAKSSLIAETAAWIFGLGLAVEDEEFTMLLFVGDDTCVFVASQLSLPQASIANELIGVLRHIT